MSISEFETDESPTALKNDLALARERANAALKAKKAFINAVSHEIRTPMNAILGMAELLSGTNLDKTQNGYLKVLRNAAAGLHLMLSDILDFARLESGTPKIENEVFSFRQLMNNVASEFRKGVYAKKKIEFSLTIADDISMYLLGDVNKLSQILRNLLSNAFKFTPCGRVELRAVKAESNPALMKMSREAFGKRNRDLIDHPLHLIEFSVTDTGIGISPENLALLFESFTQVDDSISRRYSGMGLGLCLAGKLVSLLGGGEINVVSAPGCGSTFSFRLPFAVPSEARIEEATRSGLLSGLADGDQEHAPAEGFSGKRVLIVEDNVLNQFLATEILKKAGFEVECAANGRDALEACENDSYDCIVMDIQMPVMNGLEATERLRRIDGCKTTPIIAMTAGTLEEEKKNCFEAGMDDFIHKPIERKELLRIIGKWIADGGSVRKSGMESVKPRMAGISGQSTNGAEAVRIGIYGVNTAESVQRLGLEINDYMHVLGRFSDDVPGLLDDITGAYADNDYEYTSMLCHGLAGMAGNIGANGIANLSKALEDALSGRRQTTISKLEEMLGKLKEESGNVVASIKDSLKHSTPVPDEGKEVESVVDGCTDIEMLIISLGDLEKAFQAYDLTGISSALEGIEKAGKDFAAYRQIRIIRKLVENYKFEEAVRIVRKLLSTLPRQSE